ncbi:MAG: helicase HerA-like domain-containing protein, partial [Thiothrix sp.]
DAERANLLRTSPFAGRYDNVIDRESAYELLQKRAEATAMQKAAQAAAKETEKTAQRAKSHRSREPESLLGEIGEAVLKNAVKAATSSAGRRIGTQLVRGLLGSFLKSR